MFIFNKGYTIIYPLLIIRMKLKLLMKRNNNNFLLKLILYNDHANKAFLYEKFKSKMPYNEYNKLF